MNILDDNQALVKKASYLRIMARTLVDGLKNGNFRSLYYSQGIEFNGVRDYIRGDDIRSIDWNVTARMGKPYVKMFEEEHELEIMVVVDSSLSMQIRTMKNTKYEISANAAALLCLAAEMAGCPIGAVLFDGEIRYSTKPKCGKTHVMSILSRLDTNLPNKQKGTSLAQAITLCSKMLKKRTLIFVFSDFRTGDWENPLISLAYKNDVIAFRLSDPTDEELPNIGTVPFIDVESGLKMRLPTNSKELKKVWKNYNDFLVYKWNDCCVKHRITPVILRTTDDIMDVLEKTLTSSKL